MNEAPLTVRPYDGAAWSSGEVGRFQPGRLQRFDVTERLGAGQLGEHLTQVGVGFESVPLRTLNHRVIARLPQADFTLALSTVYDWLASWSVE